MTDSFGNNLKQLMLRKNLSGRALAKQIDVPYKTVQDWLGAGNSRMPRDPDILRRLAGVFTCSVHEILFGEPDPRSLIGEILDRTEIHTGLYEITVKKVKPRGP